MKVNVTKYDVTSDGVEITESVEDIDTKQSRRCEAMAEARPGEIVVGLKINKPEVEREDYLSDLSGNDDGEPPTEILAL